MTLSTKALFGPLSAALFYVSVAGLPYMISGYSPITQTVSEIGQVGSPVRLQFTVIICLVSTGVLVFASAMRTFALLNDRTTLPSYLTARFSVSAIGASVFAYPHPWHNLFGESELIAYCAPIAVFFGWKRDSKAQPIVIFSGLMAIVIWLAIAVNLLPIFRPTLIWPHIKSSFGLIQRALFAAWFIWIAGAGFILSRPPRHTLSHPGSVCQ